MSPKRQTVISLFKKQRGQCSLCGNGMSLQPGKPNSATMEHSIPRSRMGEFPLGRPEGDITAACYRCNQIKGSMTIDEFFLCLPAYREFLGRKYHRLARLADQIEAEEARSANTASA